MLRYKLHLILSAVIFFIACRNSKEEVVSKGSEYFPLKVGDIRYYQSDTIIFDFFNKKVDTISHTIREEVAEFYIDNTLDTVYRITLSRYNEQTVDWVAFRSFERKIRGLYAIEDLNNNPEVKMLFPIASYKTRGSSYTWNVNMLNQKEPVLLKFTSVFTPFNNGFNTYSNCVSVKMNKPRKDLVHQIREEVYAKNIGLVYRYTDSTDYLLNDTTFPSGKITILRLKN